MADEGGVMTLLIASLLIYHYNMEWWWYGVALVIWIEQVTMYAELAGSNPCRYRAPSTYSLDDD